jgi:hypothetical protein
MNARELAALTWLAIFLVVALSTPAFRRGLPGIALSLITPAVAAPLLGLLSWVGFLFYLGAQAGLWDAALSTDAVIWFVGMGLPLFGRSIDVFKPRGSFRRVAVASLGLTSLVEGFANLYVLPFAVEFLVLLPLIFSVTTLLAVAEAKNRYDVLTNVLSGALAVIGLGLLVYVAVHLISDFDGFVHGTGPKELLLPVWLTVGTLPFVAVLGTYSVYNKAFNHIRWAAGDDRRTRWSAMLALVSKLHVHARQVAAFNGPWAKRLTAATSPSEAHAVIRRFRTDGNANPHEA